MADPITDADLDDIEERAKVLAPEWHHKLVAVVAALREARAERAALGVRIQQEWAKTEARDVEIGNLRGKLTEAEAVLRGALTCCRECRDESPSGATLPPADFIIWGKLAPADALGPKCHDHAVAHLGQDLPRRADQYAVVDLRPLRAAADRLRGEAS